MGLMFGKIIPIKELAQMPLPFVHRLRDLRIKQLEEAQKQQQVEMQKQNKNNGTGQQARPNFALDPAMFNGTPYDDIIDELT